MYENPETSVSSARALIELNQKREDEDRRKAAFTNKTIQLASEQVTSAKIAADESAAQTNLLKEANRHALELNEIAWRAEERAKAAEKAAAFARRSAIVANIIAVFAIVISIRKEIWELVINVISLFH